MIKDNIELYLSEDILQGEEVPFYILFKREDIQYITLEFSGFISILEYYNLRSDFPPDKKTIRIDEMNFPNYFGGVIKAGKFENPFQKAFLRATVILSNGEKIELIEERTLYNVSMEVEHLPEYINIPISEAPVKLRLKGSPTVFITIESAEDSDLEITLPKDVHDALEKLYSNLRTGFQNLKVEFPEYGHLVNIFLRIMEEPLDPQVLDELASEIKKADPTKSFNESFTLVVVNAILSQSSIRDRIFIPLLSYLNSAASRKAFLLSPLSCIYIPKGGGKLKLVVGTQNILEYYGEFTIEGRNSKALTLETNIKSDEEIIIPVKNLIEITRD